MFLYDRLHLFGFVTLFEGAVFGFLPKCASNGVIFMVLFGISLMFWTIFAIIVVMSSDDRSVSSAITPNLRLICF